MMFCSTYDVVLLIIHHSASSLLYLMINSRGSMSTLVFLLWKEEMR